MQQPLNVMVVEDEAVILLYLKRCLAQLGHRVVASTSEGERATELASLHRPDIILMDIRLSGEKDGIESGREIYRKFHIPIIYLTAHHDAETRARALETEPFGYLVKPISDENLQTALEIAIAKHRHILSLNDNLQRSHINRAGENEQMVNLGTQCYFLIDKQTLFFNGQPVKLTRKALGLLCLLVDHRNTIVSFDQIQRHVWNDEPMNHASLRNLIMQIRRMVPAIDIQTISGIGYMLATPMGV